MREVSTVLMLRMTLWFSGKHNDILNIYQRHILFVSEHTASELYHYPLLLRIPIILIKNLHITGHSKFRLLILINEVLLSEPHK